jgi:hypothetical protein
MEDTIGARLAALDWTAIEQSLWRHGYAKTPPVLTPEECAALIAMYGERERFRSRVEMERFRFGVGDYQYFAAPLPPLVEALRVHAYPPLAAIANRWEDALGTRTHHPATLARMQALCRRHGQTKPTPLLLHYEAGGYNCLHQDLYGEHVLPLQVAILLSQPLQDFSGGEFVLTEQRPRMQSRAQVVPLNQGDAVIFAVHHRPVRGSRGFYRVNMRHGVSQVRSGSRHTAGIIFHDGK